MRIISGKHKGKKLIAPHKSKTRPITNKAKEKLFGFLGDDVRDKMVLDLYAGTGAIGLEALSRSCKKVTFVEVSYAAADVLTRNIAICKEHQNTKIYNIDTLKFIKINDDSYDLIFCAPPYEISHYTKFLNAINEKHLLLSDDGQMIIECSKHSRTDSKLTNLIKVHEVHQRDTVFEVWKKAYKELELVG